MSALNRKLKHSHLLPFRSTKLPLSILRTNCKDRTTSSRPTLSSRGIDDREALQASARHIAAFTVGEVGLQTVHIAPDRLRADGEEALQGGDITIERGRRVGSLADAGVETADEVVAALGIAEERLGGDVEEAVVR